MKKLAFHFRNHLVNIYLCPKSWSRATKFPKNYFLSERIRQKRYAALKRILFTHPFGMKILAVIFPRCLILAPYVLVVVTII